MRMATLAPAIRTSDLTPGLPHWPAPDLRHLQRLTDDCGVIQHAKYWCPDYATGYCTDDNSRALLAALGHARLFEDDLSRELAIRYLAFLYFAQRRDGQMVNCVSYARQHQEAVGSQDSLGRTLWALGTAATDPDDGIAAPAREMFLRALPHLTPSYAPHALAYALLGLAAYGQCPACSADAVAHARPLAEALCAHYAREHRPEWPWPLPDMTYDNARLPQALLLAGALCDDTRCREIGLVCLNFLNRVTLRDGVLAVVGNRGWYPRGGRCALFDQQPIDAGAMVEANLAAWRLTGDTAYRATATRAMAWFYGANLINRPLYDPQSGGCCDGLHADGINTNQGAESTIVHIQAQLAMSGECPEYYSAKHN